MKEKPSWLVMVCHFHARVLITKSHWIFLIALPLLFYFKVYILSIPERDKEST